MDLSIIIPTHARPDKAAACAASLARQSLDASRYEVLFALDGHDDVTERAVTRAWQTAGGRTSHLHILPCPRAGYNAARNALLPHCRADKKRGILLSLNDDVTADPELLTEHLRAHDDARARGLRGACISGAAAWKLPPPNEDTLIDRLIRETSMVFFHDQMTDAKGASDPYKDWGFRHNYGLNFSVPMWAINDPAAAGPHGPGFTAFPLTYGHDDIEFAWRLKRAFGFPVWHRPTAIVTHDHRYRAADILEREHNLGIASWRFASAIPDFGRALFSRDITSESELEYSREFLARERATADKLRATFLALDTVRANSVPSANTPEGRTLIAALYQQHLLLKRYTWRQGLLEAAATDSTTHATTQRAAQRVPAITAA